MKKIKLFALAAFAMLSTNVFAQTDGTSATKVFTFDHFADGTATITGFVADLDDEFKTATAIPETVAHPVEKDGEGKPLKYQVKKIAKDAFANEPIETITFPAAVEEDDYTGINDIGSGAFAGTKIKKLDLSNTIIKQIKNFFGTKIAAAPKDDKTNAYLTSVIFPATITSVKENAFWGCTKLETVDMTAAVKLTDANFGAGAFAGCPIKNLDLSKNVKVTQLKANTLYDNARYFASTALETVTVHKDFTAFNNNLTGAAKLKSVTGHIYVKATKAEETSLTVLLPGEFKGCAALTTFDTKYITTFDDNCFDGCTAFATASLAKATKIGERAFAGTALKSVAFPSTGLTTIGVKAFFECASLATVAFNVAADNKTKVTTIKDGAFGYTAITSFTLPAANTAGFTIEDKAFVGCSSLTEFTYAPATITAGASIKIGKDAFNRCSNVKFATTENFAADWRATYGLGNPNYNGPTNTKFSYDVSDGKTKFDLTPYKSNSKKYYVKWNGEPKINNVATPTAIKIKKDEAKVYAAYVDTKDGSLNLSQYYSDGGYVYIAASDVALIITEKEDLKWEKQTAAEIAAIGSTSWQTTPATAENLLVDGATNNALKYVAANTTRASLESAVAEGWYIYGWVNKSDACGFQKIASGTTINAGVLFAWAKPAAGGRLTINWYDENGNLESETTAIDGVKVAAQAEGQRYNVAGQKVGASYKGLVIKDGKKYMQK